MKLCHWFLFSMCLLLSACVLTDRYNARAFEQLQTLQNLSLRFLDDASQTPWNEAQLARDDQTIQAQFKQAWLLANRHGDAWRLDNLAVLNKSYSRLYTRVMQRHQPLTSAQRHVYQQQIQQAWQLAMQGECLRAWSTCPVVR